MSDPFHPYAELFASPKGPGDARPTASKIIQDADLINKWAGKVVLITGGNGGIGIEIARAMHTTGADVYITARDQQKGQAAIADIAKSSEGKGKLDAIEMELGSLASVKKAAASFLEKSNKLNVLITQAGIMAVPELRMTTDGFEQQFGVNYLSHYTLTALLLPTLISSSTPDFNSRVVGVTSSGHSFSPVRFDDIHFSTGYHPWLAYGQSKTAQIWLSNYIDRHYSSAGVHANSVHPGAIMTGLLQHVPDEEKKEWAKNPEFLNAMKSPEQGAATVVWAAVAEFWEGNGGRFLADCGVGVPAKDTTDIKDEGYAPHAFDVEGEERLWKLSAEMAGVEVVGV